MCARYPFVEEGEFIMSASRPLIITHVSSGDSRNRGILMEYSTVDVGKDVSKIILVHLNVRISLFANK